MIRFLKNLFSSPKKKPTPSYNANLNVRAAVMTDVGMIRKNNEDSCFFLSSDNSYLAIVADGMGGHASGEIASKMAIDIISQNFKNEQENIEQMLYNAYSMANAHIYATAQQNPAHKGMGTTCTTVVVKENIIYYAHIGDSRLYLLNQNGLIKISEDHTYVNELVKQGTITPEAALKHPDRNVLSRAMGTQKSPKIDVAKSPYYFELGNKLLLCSDGLYDYLEDGELVSILKTQNINDAVYYMVEIAKQRGGHDNITVVVLECENNSENSINIRSTIDIDMKNDR